MSHSIAKAVKFLKPKKAKRQTQRVTFPPDSELVDVVLFDETDSEVEPITELDTDLRFFEVPTINMLDVGLFSLDQPDFGDEPGSKESPMKLTPPSISIDHPLYHELTVEPGILQETYIDDVISEGGSSGPDLDDLSERGVDESEDDEDDLYDMQATVEVVTQQEDVVDNIAVTQKIVTDERETVHEDVEEVQFHQIQVKPSKLENKGLDSISPVHSDVGVEEPEADTRDDIVSPDTQDEQDKQVAPSSRDDTILPNSMDVIVLQVETIPPDATDEMVQVYKDDSEMMDQQQQYSGDKSDNVDKEESSSVNSSPLSILNEQLLLGGLLQSNQLVSSEDLTPISFISIITDSDADCRSSSPFTRPYSSLSLQSDGLLSAVPKQETRIAEIENELEDINDETIYLECDEAVLTLIPPTNSSSSVTSADIPVSKTSDISITDSLDDINSDTSIKSDLPAAAVDDLSSSEKASCSDAQSSMDSSYMSFDELLPTMAKPDPVQCSRDEVLLASIYSPETSPTSSLEHVSQLDDELTSGSEQDTLPGGLEISCSLSSDELLSAVEKPELLDTIDEDVFLPCIDSPCRLELRKPDELPPEFELEITSEESEQISEISLVDSLDLYLGKLNSMTSANDYKVVTNDLSSLDEASNPVESSSLSSYEENQKIPSPLSPTLVSSLDASHKISISIKDTSEKEAMSSSTHSPTASPISSLEPYSLEPELQVVASVAEGIRPESDQETSPMVSEMSSSTHSPTASLTSSLEPDSLEPELQVIESVAEGIRPESDQETSPMVSETLSDKSDKSLVDSDTSAKSDQAVADESSSLNDVSVIASTSLSIATLDRSPLLVDNLWEESEIREDVLEIIQKDDANDDLSSVCPSCSQDSTPSPISTPPSPHCQWTCKMCLAIVHALENQKDTVFSIASKSVFAEINAEVDEKYCETKSLSSSSDEWFDARSRLSPTRSNSRVVEDSDSSSSISDSDSLMSPEKIELFIATCSPVASSDQSSTPDKINGEPIASSNPSPEINCGSIQLIELCDSLEQKVNNMLQECEDESKQEGEQGPEGSAEYEPIDIEPSPTVSESSSSGDSRLSIARIMKQFEDGIKDSLTELLEDEEYSDSTVSTSTSEYNNALPNEERALVRYDVHVAVTTETQDNATTSEGKVIHSAEDEQGDESRVPLDEPTTDVSSTSTASFTEKLVFSPGSGMEVVSGSTPLYDHSPCSSFMDMISTSPKYSISDSSVEPSAPPLSEIEIEDEEAGAIELVAIPNIDSGSSEPTAEIEETFRTGIMDEAEYFTSEEVEEEEKEEVELPANEAEEELNALADGIVANVIRNTIVSDDDDESSYVSDHETFEDCLPEEDMHYMEALDKLNKLSVALDKGDKIFKNSIAGTDLSFSSLWNSSSLDPREELRFDPWARELLTDSEFEYIRGVLENWGRYKVKF